MKQPAYLLILVSLISLRLTKVQSVAGFRIIEEYFTVEIASTSANMSNHIGKDVQL